MLARLGGRMVRHRWLVLGAWLVVLAAALASAGELFDRMVSVESAPPGAESSIAQRQLDELDPTGEIVSAVIGGVDFFDPATRDDAVRVMYEIRAVPGVVRVVDAYTGGGLVSDDGRSSLVTVELDLALGKDDALVVAQQVAEMLHGIDAPEVLVGGELLGTAAFLDQAMTDAMVGEGLAVLALIVLLTLVLGGFVVGVLPVVVALFVIAVSLLVTTGASLLVPVSDFVVNIVTILGLGLSVDYVLLVVFRFREERRRAPLDGLEVVMARTVAGAGRAVLVSGLIIFVALCGVVALGDPLMTGMAVGGAAAALVAALAGVTLVPASLALVHRRIPAPGARTWARPWPPPARPRMPLLARLARVAQRHAALVAVVGVAGLAVLGAPAVSTVVDSSDSHALPASAEARRAYDAMLSRFSVLDVEPVVVVVDAPLSAPGVVPLFDRIAVLPDAEDAELVPDLGDRVVALAVTPAGGEASGPRAQELVHAIRDLPTDLAVRVAGPAAESIDTQAQLLDRLPGGIALVVAATFALIFFLTRSLVLPIKALLLSALTILSTLGVLVAVFQWGWGAEVLGVEAWGAIDASTPLFIGFLAFGLTMDYEVFLLSRITERWNAGRDAHPADPRRRNDAAVLDGIQDTGPVVTLAAVAIGIVFLGFCASGIGAMKAVGFGMLVAVCLDVTVIRGLLLPAAMSLLGGVNWWPGRTARDVPVTSTSSRPRRAHGSEPAPDDAARAPRTAQSAAGVE